MEKSFKVRVEVLKDNMWIVKDMFFNVPGKTYKEVAHKVFDMEHNLYRKGLSFRIAVNNTMQNRLSSKLFYYDN